MIALVLVCVLVGTFLVAGVIAGLALSLLTLVGVGLRAVHA